MDEMVETFGQRGSLTVEIDWSTPAAPSTSAEFTYGKIRVLLGDEPVWSGESESAGFEWTWIELAEFLANGWPWLTAEEDFPLGIRGGTLDEVTAELNRLWDSKSEAVRELEQEKVYQYRECHDLASALQGATLPSIWIVKQGLKVWICSSSRTIVADASQTWETLERVADAIVDRALRANDERAKELDDAWKQRASIPETEALEIVTGLDQRVLAAISAEAGQFAFWGLDVADLTQNELVAAARMSATLPVEDIRRIVDAVRGTGFVDFEKLDLTSIAVAAELPAGTPFDQGYTAATWLRSHLGLPEDRRLDPADVYSEWNIEVKDLILTTPIVDAIACWGPRHGPAIYINQVGRFARSDAGQRSTLAHEICHLLLDRHGALPLVEVLGGRTPARVEERARAFAAELLAPREYVGREFAASDDPRRTLARIKRRYKVGSELVAWQARNSSVMLPVEARAFLRSQVSQPWRF